MISTAFLAGSTSKEVLVRAFTVSTGLAKTDLVFNTSGIAASYKRAGANSAVSISLATVAVNGAWTSGGFVHVFDGWYRLCVPNAALSAGVDSVIISVGGVTDCIFMGAWVDLMGEDPRSSDPIQADIRKINNVAIVGNGVSPKFGV